MSSPNIPGLVTHLIDVTSKKLESGDMRYAHWLDATTLYRFGFEIQESTRFDAHISPEKLFLEAIGCAGMSVVRVAGHGVDLEFQVKNHNIVGAMIKDIDTRAAAEASLRHEKLSAQAISMKANAAERALQRIVKDFKEPTYRAMKDACARAVEKNKPPHGMVASDKQGMEVTSDRVRQPITLSPRVAARRRAVANLKAHREGRMNWAAFVVQRDHDKSE